MSGERQPLGFALSGVKWANPNITYSFMPDGTVIGMSSSPTLSLSNLFAAYAAYALKEWQDQFRRALVCWSQVTPLSFTEVADDGSPMGSPGPAQGNPKFGDIRLGAYPSTSSALAYSYYPYQSTTKGGDIILNSRTTYKIGAVTDLFSVLLHEVGHALGLGHSAVYGSVMGSSVTQVFTGLGPDDIAGIQAIYGKRV